jgi:response regulator RpfG family c-di-GMP phosphodiesterase
MGPDKEYVEPSMKIIEDMKEADLWREGALQELRERQVREAEKGKKEAELKREQNIDVAAMDIRAGRRVFGDGGLKKKRMFRK